MTIALQFAEDPTAELDTSCMAQTLRVDPSLQREDLAMRAEAALSTTDPWSVIPPL